MADVPPVGAAAGGVITLGGDLTINRLGFGAMRITGPGILGEPPDRVQATAVLRRAVELGVNFIDTADSYGPHVSENLIAEALHPYPADLVVATKGGLERPGPGQWTPNGRPEHLRQACDGSLRRLRIDQIPLYQFHRPDPDLPLDESIGALAELQAEGKIRHLGLCNVTEEQLRTAQRITAVVSVQNRYNVDDRRSDGLVDLCRARGPGVPAVGPDQGDRGRPRRRHHCSGARRHAHPGRPGLAVATLAGDAADPRYRHPGPPGGERRRRRPGPVPPEVAAITQGRPTG